MFEPQILIADVMFLAVIFLIVFCRRKMIQVRGLAHSIVEPSLLETCKSILKQFRAATILFGFHAYGLLGFAFGWNDALWAATPGEFTGWIILLLQLPGVLFGFYGFFFLFLIGVFRTNTASRRLRQLTGAQVARGDSPATRSSASD